MTTEGNISNSRIRPGSQVALEDVSKIFESSHGHVVEALNHVSLHVAPGEFLTLLGPSGCGKSTTLRCIAGLEGPDSGTIRIGDSVVADDQGYVPAHKRRIGLVFQSYALWPHMTVADNVRYPLRYEDRASTGLGGRLRRLPKESHERIETALEQVGLGGYGKRWVGELSGGQQQRVAVARAIVANPGLVLLDEPLSNLDAQLRRQMRTELRRLAKQQGYTTIYVTHDQAEALSMSDRIAVMRDGVIEQVGTPREVYTKPKTRFVAEFLSSGLLTLTGTVERTAESSEDLLTVRVEKESYDGQHPGETTGINGTFIGDPIASGAPVELWVRTNHIQLRDIDRPMTPSMNAIHAVVEDVHFMGNRSEAVVRIADGRLVSVTSEDDPLRKEGDRVRIEFAPSDVFVFPVNGSPPDEERLERGRGA